MTPPSHLLFFDIVTTNPQDDGCCFVVSHAPRPGQGLSRRPILQRFGARIRRELPHRSDPLPALRARGRSRTPTPLRPLRKHRHPQRCLALPGRALAQTTPPQMGSALDSASTRKALSRQEASGSADLANLVQETGTRPPTLETAQSRQTMGSTPPSGLASRCQRASANRRWHGPVLADDYR